MTKKEWIAKTKANLPDLRDLIARYHPSSKGFGGISLVGLPITAPGAEEACGNVRKAIAGDPKNLNPLLRFQEAIDKQDISTMYSILNDAWFGVPESTSCWRIRGFSIAVDLMEDVPMPDEMEEA